MEPTGRGTPSGRSRWAAVGWDYVLILGWLAVLAVVAGAARGAGLLTDGAAVPAPVLVTDLLVFSVTVLPVWAYFTLREAGSRHAGPGKLRTGLRVVVERRRGHDEQQADVEVGPGLARAAVRNAVKWLPWQLAHVAVARAILGTDGRVVMAVTYGLSLLLPLVSVVMAWRDPWQRALHDRIAGTRVVRRASASASFREHRAALDA